MFVPRFSHHACIAFGIRLCFIYYGVYQDSLSPSVKFTDVDYRVFTDAARYISQGQSPYLRHTYRYTPVLAWCLHPSLGPLFGKLLFCFFDIIAGYAIYAIVRRIEKCDQVAINCAALWLYNPIVCVISARGSAESIVVTLVLTVLFFYGEKLYVLCGMALGLAIHVKLYPVIYCLSLYTSLSHYNFSFHGNFFRSPRFRLFFGTTSILSFLTLLCVYLYGVPFLQETILYHVTREDIRHNFSVYFYMFYLLVDIENNVGLGIVAFLPQLILLLAITWKYGNTRDLPFCFFCQTFVFVTYNKVCTSQYFVWYLALLPLCVPRLKFSRWEIVVCCTVWLFAQASWLLPAYFLEFKGYNTFLFIWLEGIAFFTANVGLLAKFFRKYAEQLILKED